MDLDDHEQLQNDKGEIDVGVWDAGLRGNVEERGGMTERRRSNALRAFLRENAQVLTM